MHENDSISMLECESTTSRPDRAPYVPASSGQSPHIVRGSLHSQSVDAIDSVNDASVRKGAAIQPGGPVTLFTSDNVGLVVNYAAVGVVYGLCQSLTYPFFKIYLNIEGYQANSAEVLMALAWSFKCVFGVASDCLPINGYRRKPYIYLGWAMSLLFSLIIATMSAEKPYMKDGHVYNAVAASAGAKYVVLMMLMSFGYVIADVACDGMMVEFAQREPEEIRGQAQTTMYSVRYTFHLLSTFTVAILCNSNEYGGSFSFSVSVNALMVLATVASAVGIYATFRHLQDQRVMGQAFTHRCQALWVIAQHRSTWQIMIYTFISRVCFSYYASSAKAIYEYWVDIDPLMSNLFNCVNPGIYALMAYLLRRHYLNMSWHTLTKVSVCGSIFTSFVATMLTVFKIIRSPMFTLLMEQLTNFFDAISYYVVIFSIVEVAEPGYESTSYSLITTVANLGIPFAVSLSNMVGSQFTVYDKDLKQDTSKVRWQVAYCYFIMYGLRLLNLLALPLLPKQKKYARELKMFGGSSLLMARIVFGVSGVALFWSLLTTLLSVFASTACLTIAGGEGC